MDLMVRSKVRSTMSSLASFPRTLASPDEDCTLALELETGVWLALASWCPCLGSTMRPSHSNSFLLPTCTCRLEILRCAGLQFDLNTFGAAEPVIGWMQCFASFCRPCRAHFCAVDFYCNGYTRDS